MSPQMRERVLRSFALLLFSVSLVSLSFQFHFLFSFFPFARLRHYLLHRAWIALYTYELAFVREYVVVVAIIRCRCRRVPANFYSKRKKEKERHKECQKEKKTADAYAWLRCVCCLAACAYGRCAYL